jgi:hypothetical protein
MVYGQYADKRCAGGGSFFFEAAYPWHVLEALFHVVEWEGDQAQHLHRHTY